MANRFRVTTATIAPTTAVTPKPAAPTSTTRRRAMMPMLALTLTVAWTGFARAKPKMSRKTVTTATYAPPISVTRNWAVSTAQI